MPSGLSPSKTVKEVEAQIRRSLREVDSETIDSKTKHLIFELRQSINDAKTYANDYELSETREEQLNNARRAKHFLAESRKAVLAVSEQGIFSAIDVAHLSAQIDSVYAELR